MRKKQPFCHTNTRNKSRREYRRRGGIVGKEKEEWKNQLHSATWLTSLYEDHMIGTWSPDCAAVSCPAVTQRHASIPTDTAWYHVCCLGLSSFSFSFSSIPFLVLISSSFIVWLHFYPLRQWSCEIMWHAFVCYRYLHDGMRKREREEWSYGENDHKYYKERNVIIGYCCCPATSGRFSHNDRFAFLCSWLYTVCVCVVGIREKGPSSSRLCSMAIDVSFHVVWFGEKCNVRMDGITRPDGRRKEVEKPRV